MKTIIRKTLIASSIAAALALPAAGTFAQTEQDRSWDKDNKKSEMHDQNKSKPAESTLRGNSGKVVTDTPDSAATAAAKRGQAQDHNAQAPKQDLTSYVYTQSADDLEGAKVVDRDGKDVGDIKSVVLDRDHHRAYAVVAVGGVMGMGARDILVPFNDLSREGNDNLQMRASMQEIENLATHEKETYQELKGDAPISDSIAGNARSLSSTEKPSTK